MESVEDCRKFKAALIVMDIFIENQLSRFLNSLTKGHICNPLLKKIITFKSFAWVSILQELQGLFLLIAQLDDLCYCSLVICVDHLVSSSLRFGQHKIVSDSVDEKKN